MIKVKLNQGFVQDIYGDKMRQTQFEEQTWNLTMLLRQTLIGVTLKRNNVNLG